MDIDIDADLSALAGAIADRSRARMLCLLMDGRAYTATELAIATDIAPSTASAHLARLVGQGLLQCVQQGRHRYYRIEDPAVAHLIENMMGIAAGPQDRIPVRTPAGLRLARTCYDHLAGEIAVMLYAHMHTAGWLVPGEGLTRTGIDAMTGLGVDVTQKSGRRRFACDCLDWSERRPHLGGTLGAALLDALLKQGHVQRMPDTRALFITPHGQRCLQTRFGIDMAACVSPPTDRMER